ncbi:MAG: hypothetical protein LKF96_07595 [Treponema sp.]|nr:hypothetical protein [Treponema sp.]
MMLKKQFLVGLLVAFVAVIPVAAVEFPVVTYATGNSFDEVKEQAQLINGTHNWVLKSISTNELTIEQHKSDKVYFIVTVAFKEGDGINSLIATHLEDKGFVVGKKPHRNYARYVQKLLSFLSR